MKKISASSDRSKTSNTLRIIFGLALTKVSQSVPLAIFSLLLLGLVNCAEDETNLPSRTLQGAIDGDSTWVYGSANAYLFSSDQRYRARFLSDAETATDPCTVPSPTLRHVVATFRPQIGSYFVTPMAVENNQVQVNLAASAAESVVASSGFMEIYAIENLRIYGYLQAVLDEGNSVEGSFEIKICN